MKHINTTAMLLAFMVCCTGPALATQLTNVGVGGSPTGSYSYDSATGQYTLTGKGVIANAGNNYNVINGFGDFAYTALSGNFTVTAHIADNSGTGWQGLMAMNSLSPQDMLIGSIWSPNAGLYVPRVS